MGVDLLVPGAEGAAAGLEEDVGRFGPPGGVPGVGDELGPAGPGGLGEFENELVLEVGVVFGIETFEPAEPERSVLRRDEREDVAPVAVDRPGGRDDL